jgi:hypothetical protein
MKWREVGDNCILWSFIICTLRQIIRMVKSRIMRWAGHIARMRRRGMHVGFLGESQKERDHWEDLY